MSTAKRPEVPALLPKRAPGRPSTGKAVPNKERQEAVRQRLTAAGKVRLELKVSTQVRDQLDELRKLTGLDRDGAAELAISEKHRRLIGVSGVEKASQRRT